jgi:spore maturation protein CgeB
MRVVVFPPLVVAGGNPGTAHFLRGVVTELKERGHEVAVQERADGWGRVDSALDDADLVLVHERNDPGLVARIGAHRARHDGYRLLFHDTHYRAVTAPEERPRFDLSAYDGVLAGGETVRRAYLDRGWAGRAWTWHEAADTRVFRPLSNVEPEADLVWIGDWGEGGRSEELRTFLLRPARLARLRGSIYGSHFPRSERLRMVLSRLHRRGRVADHRLPELFARHRLTVHVPRRADGEAPGVPGSRPFEAMACGIPLISAPWDDCDGLFRTEQDYLVARDGAEMREGMEAIVEYPELAEKLRTSGLETIRARHTCAHRVDELLAIDAGLRGNAHIEFVTS